jgi:hypothetical protein
MTAGDMLTQDIKINKIIESCVTPEHYQSCMNLLRNAAIPRQEKIVWAEMLKEKALSEGITIDELFSS